MRFCTLKTNVQHILLASQRYRVGPEFAVVRIGNWPFTLPIFPFIIGCREFYIGSLWGKGGLGGQKHRWDSKLEMYCRYQKLGRWEDTAQDLEVWKQQLNGF